MQLGGQVVALITTLVQVGREQAHQGRDILEAMQDVMPHKAAVAVVHHLAAAAEQVLQEVIVQTAQEVQAAADYHLVLVVQQ